MQTPMISIPLKETDDVDWIHPLKTYIQKFHDMDPGKYTEECALLQRLRQDMRGAGKDSESSRDLLYRYCGQLEFLDRRFTVDENNVKIPFTWYDAFTHKPTSQYSLAYEKACVIFNIAAILSCNAAARNRDAEDGLKKVWHEFQLAAGMLRYLNENFQYAPSTDLDRNTVSTLDTIMLAQAQEAFFERQVRRKTKVLMIAKLAGHAASLWAQAVDGIQDNVNKEIFDKSWLLLVQCKATLFTSLSQYYQALADTSGAKSKVPDYGAQITRLQIAFKQASEAKVQAKSFPKISAVNANLGPETGASLISVTEKHWSMVKEKLDEAKMDNDKIYHQAIPSETSLNAVETLSSANPTRIGKSEIDQIIGADIFNKLVPMWVVESASLYDSQKDNVRRATRDHIEYAYKRKAEILGDGLLPIFLILLKAGASKEVLAFKEIKGLCEDIAAHPPANEVLNELATTHNYLTSLLTQSLEQLDEESGLCEKMRLRHGEKWTQQSSGQAAATLRHDIRRYQKAMKDGQKSDAEVAGLCPQYETERAHMRIAGSEIQSEGISEKAKYLYEEAVVKASSERSGSKQAQNLKDQRPSLIDHDSEDYDRAVARYARALEGSLTNLNQIENSMRQTAEDMDSKMDLDSINQDLIEIISNKKQISDPKHPLFVARLEDFQVLEKRAADQESVHSDARDDLQRYWNNIQQDQRFSRDLAVSKVLVEHKEIWNNFEIILGGIRNAQKFYPEMEQAIRNLSQNIATFLTNRESERATLLQQLEGKPSIGKPFSGPEYDKNRLTDLMNRMNVDATSPDPPSHHRRPEPLRNTPPYYQTYNPAKSPPLSSGLPQHHHAPFNSPYGMQNNHQRYAQQSGVTQNNTFGYDPKHYGPVSPPAGQQAFEQATHNFHGKQPPSPHQYQSPVPAGYVPPPPPPRPPPSHSSQVQNDNDPWGGLSGWE